jgi:opine dehydrogenase
LRGDYSRPIPSHKMSKSLLRCGVIGSLVPLKSAGNIANVQVPVTTAIITLASSVLGADVSAAGRRLEAIGIDSGDIDTARRAMDAIATGEKYGR